MSSVARLFEQANRLQAAGDCAAAIAAWLQLLQRAPQDWQARLNLANAYQQSAQYPLALEHYLAVLAQQPAAQGARVNLAQLLKQLGEYALAADLLHEVLQQQPDNVDALSALSLVQLYLGQPDAAVATATRACALAPQRLALAVNLGLLLTQQRRYADAESCLSEAMARFGAEADLRWNRAIVRLYRGDYAGAWPDYEARFDSVMAARHTGLPRFDWAQPCSRLLLWAEQGLGDSIMVMRLLPLLGQRFAGAIVIEAPAALHRLLHSVLPQAVLTVAASDADGDAQLPMMSLPGLLQLRREQLDGSPYLTPDAGLVQQWQQRLAASRRHELAIGLVWASGAWGVGAADYNRQRKSMAPAQLLPLLQAVSGCDWVSLQLGEPAGVLAGHMIDVSADITDMADTLAMIASLDLVVTVDTAVAHLAAAMGKPVWVMMRYEGAPFFGEHDDMPWYGTLRVFRQPAPGDWDSVLGDMLVALSQSN